MVFAVGVTMVCDAVPPSDQDWNVYTVPPLDCGETTPSVRRMPTTLPIAAGVAIVAALSLLGSVFLTATANGIAVFMIFGAGLVAGLLGSIGHALNSHTLQHSAKIAAWLIPFEGLYQDGLREITANTTGFTGFLLQLGPFGGAYTGGTLLRLWALAYLALVGVVAMAGFARKDL